MGQKQVSLPIFELKLEVLNSHEYMPRVYEVNHRANGLIVATMENALP